MRIGELSRRSGLSRDTIRFYERSGLIRAGAREGQNNYKSYDEGALLTLEIVREAQAAGISVGDIAIILSQLNAEEGDGFDGEAFLDAKIAEVQARIAASERFLDTLRQTRAALAVAHLDAPPADQ